LLYLFLTNGSEELEAIAPLDILRRAGIAVQSVGIGGKTVVGSHGVAITCDITESDLDFSKPFTGVILPGGPGWEALAASPAVQEALRQTAAQGGLLAAICAAPAILGRAGLLQGCKATCFPGFEEELRAARFCNAPVVRDGNRVTSRGAGTAIAFGLALATYLSSPEKAEAVAAAIQCP
jgi:4-methyl-5(b-hydroxyethyl)-thiazole monophosphate biosynthesis